jgi:farnesyl-diphosphate farnesyltransferase
MECGTGHYKDLMAQYPLVTQVFLGLEAQYQAVIADICDKMGNGMADFIPQEVKTVEQYDLYCHYVAGLVGIGLSQLFASSGAQRAAPSPVAAHLQHLRTAISPRHHSPFPTLSSLTPPPLAPPLPPYTHAGLESPEFAAAESLSNEMGLFLQKTNIIRDYLEDINEEPAPRMFWPKEIWGGYARRLADFKQDRHADASVACLNHMVGQRGRRTRIIRGRLCWLGLGRNAVEHGGCPLHAQNSARNLALAAYHTHAHAQLAAPHPHPCAQILDALRHAEGSLEYMSRLRSRPIFRFCAIPQVMAIGTLARCFANRGVFTGVVKMRRGETAKIMWLLDDYADACGMFRAYARQIAAAAATGPADPATTPGVLAACARLEAAAMARIRAAAERGSAAALAASVAPISLVSRVVMVLLAALYVWAAWHADEVRALAGLPHGAAPASMDALHRGVAALVLGWVVAVAAGGRRIRA